MTNEEAKRKAEEIVNGVWNKRRENDDIAAGYLTKMLIEAIAQALAVPAGCVRDENGVDRKKPDGFWPLATAKQRDELGAYIGFDVLSARVVFMDQHSLDEHAAGNGINMFNGNDRRGALFPVGLILIGIGPKQKSALSSTEKGKA